LSDLDEINKSTNFISVEYPLIECTIKIKDKEIKRIAFNEVDIRADTGKVLNLDIFLKKV
jgi:hypothetical protein